MKFLFICTTVVSASSIIKEGALLTDNHVSRVHGNIRRSDVADAIKETVKWPPQDACGGVPTGIAQCYPFDGQKACYHRSVCDDGEIDQNCNALGKFQAAIKARGDCVVYRKACIDLAVAILDNGKNGKYNDPTQKQSNAAKWWDKNRNTQKSVWLDAHVKECESAQNAIENCWQKAVTYNKNNPKNQIQKGTKPVPQCK